MDLPSTSTGDSSKTLGSLTATPSATGLITPPVVTLPPAKTLPTSAPCAAPQTMVPKHAALDPQQVSCVLILEAWETKLCTLGILDDFKDIPIVLCKGFCNRENMSPEPSSTPKNVFGGCLQDLAPRA
ncbi:hypothetical protein FRC12_007136 [Ceratobasidium sp. 428]|nr:hypothetical protein FRC12_007136 [Ceratobasidium sp. 428]